MANIHHATAKRALKLGVAIIEIPGDLPTFRAIRETDGAESAIFESAPKLLDAVEADIAEFAVPERKFGLRSGVMVKVYHDRYTANGGGCGDILDEALRGTLVDATVKGTDLELLRRIAETNEVWTQKWASLNPGMQRMNLANRLRAILRNNPTATIDIAGDTGRFGVEFSPNKKTQRKLGATATEGEGE